MQRNAGKREFLYKCACVIDEIAKQYAYDDFVEASTAARFQSLGGERGGLFRDPPQTRDAAKRYLQVRGDAMKRCDVPRLPGFEAAQRTHPCPDLQLWQPPSPRQAHVHS